MIFSNYLRDNLQQDKYIKTPIINKLIYTYSIEHKIIQALLHCIEKHPKGSENKEWFIKLIQDNLNGITSLEIDADLFYNATVVKNLLANLLAIDIKIIVKVRIVHKIINILWKENNWDIILLNSYILDDKSILQNISLN